MFSSSTKETAKDSKSSNTPVSEQVSAVKYTVMVYEGSMDFIHGGGHKITEIFVPSKNICFNEKATFKSDNARSNIVTQISLSKGLVENIIQVANLTAQLETEQTKLTANREYQTLFDEPALTIFPKRK